MATGEPREKEYQYQSVPIGAERDEQTSSDDAETK